MALRIMCVHKKEKPSSGEIRLYFWLGKFLISDACIRTYVHECVPIKLRIGQKGGDSSQTSSGADTCVTNLVSPHMPDVAGHEIRIFLRFFSSQAARAHTNWIVRDIFSQLPRPLQAQSEPLQAQSWRVAASLTENN